MAYQLEFAEEKTVRELAVRHMLVSKGPANELRRAYDALVELQVVKSLVTHQPLLEYTEFYLSAFQAYNRGEVYYAECMARCVKHLCRATWFDAKIKYLESHADDLPHIVGLTKEGARGLDQGISEIEGRLSRLKLTGLADRYGHRCRNHIERLLALPDRNTLLGDTFMKAAYEYCLSVEVLHDLEFRAVAA